MPRKVLFIAVGAAILSAFALTGPAGADHVAGQEPFFSCSASVVRANVLNNAILPTIDPLAANSNREECAEDLVGAPTVALPPPPAPAPPITATAAQASTEILCATDDPDPAVTPGNNDDCDAGRRSFEQQVLSKADAAAIRISLPGPVNPAIEITADAANTRARAFCGPGNVPTLTSFSNVVNLVVKIGGVNFPITLPPADQEQTFDLGVAKLTLNERIGTEGAKAANSPSDQLTRRAIHLEVPGGVEPTKGSVTDVIVAESVADFHGDVCNAKPPPVVCPAGSTPNAQGQCIITAINCPAGSTLNGQGQCIINAVNCPAGSTRLDPDGPCVVNNPNCPAGSSKNPQGQCVVNNPNAEGPRGGTVLPINDQIKKLFAGSPCIGRGFGPLIGIFGTNGDDRITGTNTSDRIFALAGNDRVSGGRGNDCVEGGAGNDVVDGSNGNDFLLGGSGRDRMEGGPGNDRFSGGSGKDVLSGGQGNDRFSGGKGNDRMNGGFGNDVIRGGPGNDGISNGNGKDRVYGGTGNDTINVAIVGPKAFVDCGPGKKDRARISPGKKRDITRRCEFLYIAKRTRNGGRGTR